MIVLTPPKEVQLRMYKSSADRDRAIKQLKKIGYNYHLGFADRHRTHKFSLIYGKVDWAGLFPYVNLVGLGKATIRLD